MNPSDVFKLFKKDGRDKAEIDVTEAPTLTINKEPDYIDFEADQIKQMFAEFVKRETGRDIDDVVVFTHHDRARVYLKEPR